MPRLRRGVHRHRRPGVGRRTRHGADRRVDRNRCGTTHRRAADRRALRRSSPSGRAASRKDDPADVGHHRNTQGRQATPAADPRRSRRSSTARRGTPRKSPSSSRRCSTPGASRSWRSPRRWPARSSPAASSIPRPRSRSSTTHRATGLCVVPVMFDRIMDLPDDVRRPLQRHVAALRRRVGIADAARRRDRVHGPVRRRHLQQLQRHRGGHDRDGHPGRSARGARHRGQARGGHRHPHPRRRVPRAADRRGGHHLRAQLDAVRRVHLGGHQGLPRGLHVARATSDTSTPRAGCSWWAATTR